MSPLALTQTPLARKVRVTGKDPAPQGAEPAPAGVRWLDFELPPELEAAEPAEARGLARDDVRLLVSYLDDDQIQHAHFRDLPRFLRRGDVLVVNTSGTLNAALSARRAGEPVELHLSTELPSGLWVVELRALQGGSSGPFYHAAVGDVIELPAGGTAELLAPGPGAQPGGRVRLWAARLNLPAPLGVYLQRHGFPIRYSYVRQPWPSAYYQTVFANEPGSAEMPSAGRAFTPELVTRLVAAGVQFAPLLLHTGVASLEEHEPPYDEFYRVPAESAELVNAARAAGRRVIAVGTTAVRALETAAEPDGFVRPSEGYTGLIVTPERGLRAVNGLLTGLHEPRATHLALLAALAGRDHLRAAYAEALRARYLWHEFGDLHLMLPR